MNDDRKGTFWMMKGEENIEWWWEIIIFNDEGRGKYWMMGEEYFLIMTVEENVEWRWERKILNDDEKVKFRIMTRDKNVEWCERIYLNDYDTWMITTREKIKWMCAFCDRNISLQNLNIDHSYCTGVEFECELII